jgi:hypothetical protein
MSIPLRELFVNFRYFASFPKIWLEKVEDTQTEINSTAFNEKGTRQTARPFIILIIWHPGWTDTCEPSAQP